MVSPIDDIATLGFPRILSLRHRWVSCRFQHVEPARRMISSSSFLTSQIFQSLPATTTTTTTVSCRKPKSNWMAERMVRKYYDNAQTYVIALRYLLIWFNDAWTLVAWNANVPFVKQRTAGSATLPIPTYAFIYEPFSSRIGFLSDRKRKRDNLFDTGNNDTANEKRENNIGFRVPSKSYYNFF